MYDIDTHIFMGLYVYFCNSDNIVYGYFFSYDIIVFPLCTAFINVFTAWKCQNYFADISFTRIFFENNLTEKCWFNPN